MTKDTPSTPTIFNKAFMIALFSIKFLVDLLLVLSSLVLTLSILIVLSSLGSRLTIFAYHTTSVLALFLTLPMPRTKQPQDSRTYISRQQTINRKGAPLTLIIRSEHNGNILDADHQRQGPYDEGESAKKVIVTGFGAEGGGVDVERGGADVAVDDANGLVCKPRERAKSLSPVGGVIASDQWLIEREISERGVGDAYQKRYLPLKV